MAAQEPETQEPEKWPGYQARSEQTRSEQTRSEQMRAILAHAGRLNRTFSGVLTELLDLIRQDLDEHDYDHRTQGRLSVMSQATDDQKFTQVFAATDADLVAAGTAAVTVTVHDTGGQDLSKWIDVQQDPTNPLRYTYARKPNSDGTQPIQLDFIATAMATVSGAPVAVSTDLSFVPGAPATLTATTTVEPLVATA